MGVNNDRALELETRFLSYLFSDTIYIGKALSRMKPEYLMPTRKIYQMIRWHYNKYHGIPTDEHIEMMCSKKKMASDDMIKFQTMVMEARNTKIIDEPDFHVLEDEIIDLYKRRQAMKIAEVVISSNPNTCTTEEFDAMREQVQGCITNIQTTEHDIEKEGTIEGDIDECYADYKKVKENPESLELFSTGFKKIDEAIVGFGYGTLNLVCGRKGDGKSTFLLNFGYHLWKQGVNVLFYSLEIDKKQYERRWISRAALISSKGLKSGTLTEEEEKTFLEYIDCTKKGVDFFGNKVGSVYIVDCPAGATMAYIDSKTEEIERKTGITYQAVIVDYLGIMRANNPTGVVRDDLGAISLEMKQYSRTRKKILLSAVQMNRQGKRDAMAKGGRTENDAVAGSDQVLDHADNALVCRTTGESSGIAESIKTRDGDSFTFSYEKKFNCFNVVELEDSEWNDL